jgi:hypothetical protein
MMAMNKKLNKEQLLQLLDSIAPSKVDGLSEEEFGAVISDFCAGCPDPAGAKWLLFACLDPLTDEELVDRALAMADRTPAAFPASRSFRDQLFEAAAA